ncbi:hypothetical protein pb186bvf_016294 [Paramecium bursaria]
MKLVREFYGPDISNSQVIVFKPIRFLGQVGVSKYYLTIHRISQELRKIKITEKIQIDEELQQLNQEIYNLRILNHPNIIKLDQTINTENRVYMVFQHIDGISLTDYIKQLKSGNVQRIFKQLISAIYYIHKNNIILRDLRPGMFLMINLDSIIIKETNEGPIAYIHDLGTAQQLKHPKRFLWGKVGSIEYMAPEVLLCDRQNYATDIWALGVILYNFINKMQNPFSEEDDSQNLVEIKIYVGEIKEWPAGIDEDLKDLITQCLVLNPSNRITAAQLLDHQYLKPRIRRPSFDLRLIKPLKAAIFRSPKPNIKKLIIIDTPIKNLQKSIMRHQSLDEQNIKRYTIDETNEDLSTTPVKQSKRPLIKLKQLVCNSYIPYEKISQNLSYSLIQNS